MLQDIKQQESHKEENGSDAAVFPLVGLDQEFFNHQVEQRSGCKGERSHQYRAIKLDREKAGSQYTCSNQHRQKERHQKHFFSPCPSCTERRAGREREKKRFDRERKRDEHTLPGTEGQCRSYQQAINEQVDPDGEDKSCTATYLSLGHFGPPGDLPNRKHKQDAHNKPCNHRN